MELMLATQDVMSLCPYLGRKCLF